jgi:hypothetical protein
MRRLQNYYSPYCCMKRKSIFSSHSLALLLVLLSVTSLALNCERRADNVDLVDLEGQIMAKIDGRNWISTQASANVLRDSTDSTNVGVVISIANILGAASDGSSIAITINEIKVGNFVVTPTSFSKIVYTAIEDGAQRIYSTEFPRMRGTIDVERINYPDQRVSGSFEATLRDSTGKTIVLELGRFRRVLSETPIPPPLITPYVRGRFHTYSFNSGTNVTFARQDSNFVVTGFNTRDSVTVWLRFPENTGKDSTYVVDSTGRVSFEMINKLGHRRIATPGSVIKITEFRSNSIEGTFSGRAFNNHDSTTRDVTNGAFGFNY